MQDAQVTKSLRNFGNCKNLHNTIYNFSQNSRTSDNDQILIAWCIVYIERKNNVSHEN